MKFLHYNMSTTPTTPTQISLPSITVTFFTYLELQNMIIFSRMERFSLFNIFQIILSMVVGI